MTYIKNDQFVCDSCGKDARKNDYSWAWGEFSDEKSKEKLHFCENCTGVVYEIIKTLHPADPTKTVAVTAGTASATEPVRTGGAAWENLPKPKQWDWTWFWFGATVTLLIRILFF